MTRRVEYFNTSFHQQFSASRDFTLITRRIILASRNSQLHLIFHILILIFDLLHSLHYEWAILLHNHVTFHAIDKILSLHFKAYARQKALLFDK